MTCLRISLSTFVRKSGLIALMADGRFKEINAELAAVEAALAARPGNESELQRLTAVRETLENAARTRQFERVVDALLPPDVPSTATVWHAQRNADARLALLREFGGLSASDVAKLAHSDASN